MNNDQLKLVNDLGQLITDLSTAKSDADTASSFATAANAPLLRAQFDAVSAACAPLISQLQTLQAQLKEFGQVQ